MTQNKYRISGLDGIRGLAALSVALFHLTNINFLRDFLPEHIATEYVLPFSFGFGHYGVEAFFVLSGFLIPLTLSRRSSLKSFFVARFIRLFPIFWVCAIISLFVVYFVSTREPPHSIIEYLASFTMVPRQVLGGPIYLEGVYWTLEVELLFYILIGVTFYKFNSMNLLIPFFALSLLGCLVNAVGTSTLLSYAPGALGSIFMRIYGLFILEYVNLFFAGMMIYKWYIGSKKFRDSSLLGVGLLFCCLCQSMLSLESTWVTAILLIVFVAAISTPLSLVLSSAPLVFLGYISYPLYLIHMTLGRSLNVYAYMLTGNEWISLAIAVAMVIALSYILTRWIDEPIRARLNRVMLPGGR